MDCKPSSVANRTSSVFVGIATLHVRKKRIRTLIFITKHNKKTQQKGKNYVKKTIETRKRI